MSEQQTKTEALAKHLFRYGNPNLTGEEHDRLLGMWEEVDEMVRTVWMDLAEAAYAYLSDEIDTVVERHTNGRITELEAREAHWKWEADYYKNTVTPRWRARADKAEATIARVQKALEGICDSCDYTELRAALEGEQQ